MNLFLESVNSFGNFIYDTLSSRASLSLCTTLHHKLSISPGVHVYYTNHVTQKSMDCKQAKKNIGDLYVNIKSRVDS
jgi:hypothetical protein